VYDKLVRIGSLIYHKSYFISDQAIKIALSIKVNFFVLNSKHSLYE